MSGKRILLVDDSPTALQTTGQTLSRAGYEVTTARDGQQALDLAGQSQPDLVVLDIILPKKNGYQVCRQLKNNPSTGDIKVLMLSSKSMERDRIWGEQQGADAYITKPYHDLELLKRVERLVAAAPPVADSA